MEPKYRVSDCPYQTGKTSIVCEASMLMVPSIQEEKKYCESGDFKDCPYYQEALRREREKVSR